MFCIVLLALSVRFCMVWSHYRDNPLYFHQDADAVALQISETDIPYHNLFGSEIANVAYALVCKQKWFADPFGGDTGPTGWVAPGMVMVYALAFLLFGCFSFGSVLFMFGLSLCLSIATIFLIYRVCIHLFKSRKTACVACFFYAFDPQDLMVFKRSGQQDFNTAPFLFILCFFLFLRCLRSRSAFDRAMFGLGSAAVIFCNPVFLLPVTACCIYYAAVNRSSFLRALRELTLVIVVCALLLAPYILYQQQRLHAWSFIKSNGAFELYLGNVPDFQGVLTFELFDTYHPMANSIEYRSYRDMGETAYVQSKMSVFYDTFHPARFIFLSVKRFMNFFFIYPALKSSGTVQYVAYSIRGLALVLYFLVCFRRLRSIDALMCAYIVAYALPYCCMGIMYRYSFAIVPLSAILLGRALVCAVRKSGQQMTLCRHRC